MDTATSTLTCSRPKLLIFDLDGTLVDSRLDLVVCVNATLHHCGLRTLDENTIAGYVGDGAATLVQRSLQQAVGQEDYTNAAALPFFLQHYNQHLLDHTHLYPGVLDALTGLHREESGALMAVLTNKPVRPSRRICDALGLSDFFFAVYGGNSFVTKKPDAYGLKHLWREAEARFGSELTAEEVVMVGDSHVDVLTARNAGVRVWGCTWGFSQDALLAAQPDRLAHQPTDWVDLLRDAGIAGRGRGA